MIKDQWHFTVAKELPTAVMLAMNTCCITLILSKYCVIFAAKFKVKLNLYPISRKSYKFQ